MLEVAGGIILALFIMLFGGGLLAIFFDRLSEKQEMREQVRRWQQTGRWH